MPAPGSGGISLRGDGPWQGHTTQTLAERGDRRFQLLENCYVSKDGNEIRTRPGFKCVVNPTGAAGTDGYRDYIVDASRDVLGTPIGSHQVFRDYTTAIEQQIVWNNPSHIHCAEFIDRQLVIVGESDFRRERIHVGGVDATVVSWANVAVANGVRTVDLTLNIQINRTKTDGSPFGLFNSLAPDGTALGASHLIPSYIYIEGGSSEDLGWLKGRVLRLTNVSATAPTVLRLDAPASLAANGTFATPPRLSKVRPIIGGFIARGGGHTSTSINTNTLTTGATPGFMGGRGVLDGRWVRCLTGANAGDSRLCTASTEARVDFSPAWDDPIADGDTFSIYPAPVDAGNPPPYPGLYVDDDESLTAYTVLSLPDPNSNPIQVVYPAHAANRIPDFADKDAAISANTVVEGSERSDGYWMSRRRKKSLPHRVNPHIAGNRLIMAAPGYGCVWQIPKIVQIGPDGGTSGLRWLNNDIFDRPRCLGVPKAVMIVDTNTTTGWHNQSSLAPAWAAGVYRFVVQFRDSATGESGLPSEELEITASGATGLRLAVLAPQYMMGECVATEIEVFRTDAGSATPFKFHQKVTAAMSLHYAGTPAEFSLKYGLSVPKTNAFNGETNVIAVIELWPSVTPNADIGPNDIEQMPRGCNDAVTVRGFTFFGGFLGNTPNAYSDHISKMMCAYLSGGGPPIYPDVDRVQARTTERQTPIGSGGFWGCADKNIPPAYAGMQLASIRLFPFPVVIVTLNRVMNTRGTLGVSFGAAADAPSYYWPNWKVDTSGILSFSSWNDASTRDVDTALVVEPGLFQVSEAANPGVTPATGNGHVDAPRDETIEAMGAMSDGVVMCTKTSTYATVFTQTPLAADASPIPPQTASNGLGCIAANTMVDAGGAPLWISDRGPVVFSGGVVDHVGQDIDQHFIGEAADYLRDSTGRMRHAWSCYDAERGLVYFGVFANRTNSVTVDYLGTTYSWATATDRVKGRFPCDTVLVLSISSRSWSVWHMPQPILWMFTGPDVTGKDRVYFVAADQRIYVLDDNYADYNREPFRCTVSTVSTSNAIIVTEPFSDSATALGTADNFIAVGMNIMVFEQSTTTIKSVSTITSYNAGTGIIEMADVVSVVPGDKVVFGFRTMRIKTNNLKAGEGADPASGRTLSMRYALTSRVTSGDSGVSQDSYVRARCVTPKKHGGQDVTTTYATSNLTSSFDDANRYEHLGKSEARNLVRNLKLTRGLPAGQEFEFDFELLCPAQVGLVDAAIEVP